MPGWRMAKNARFSASLLELIELVSNAGSRLTTEKYKGNDPILRASVLVFGNRPCPHALRHRAVYQLMVPSLLLGENTCDGTGSAACGCAYHARLRADLVTDFARVSGCLRQVPPLRSGWVIVRCHEHSSGLRSLSRKHIALY